MAMTPQILGHDVIVKFFWRCFIFLVKFSYWSKFFVNIITDSGVTTICFYKGLTRNPEIRNTPVWVFPNILILGRVRNTKFGTNVSNKMLLIDAECQVITFTIYELLRELYLTSLGLNNSVAKNFMFHWWTVKGWSI